MTTFPLISCLCITHNSVPQLERAINCFYAQTYPNKELLILYEDDNAGNIAYLKEKYVTDISFIEVPSNPKLPLGDLRNIAVEQCNGEYFCQWDDDDWYSSNRLEVQMEALQQSCKPATMLLYWLMFDSVTKCAYLSPFRLWEGSILCQKSVISTECNYASLVKGEDTLLLEKLLNNNSVFPVIHPCVYIYVFHGQNTWDHDHFNIFYKKGKQLSAKASQLIDDILNSRYSIEEGTALLHSPAFLEEIDFRFELVDRYSLRMV